jgi:transcriptional regulator with XRE-family HTH domain
MTMRKLALLAGISSGTVSELESGAIQPSLATMLALQSAFGLTSLEELLAPLPAPLVMPSVELAALSDGSLRSA